MENSDDCPQRRAIIGAGAVGVEFASIFGRFGSQVTLIEMLPRMQELFRDWNALENTPFEGVSVLPRTLTPYIQAQADMAHAAEGDEVFENEKRRPLAQ